MTIPTDDPIFMSLVSRVPAISSANAVSAEMLPGGLSNRNYVVDADGEQFVVRVGCDNRAILGIDRRCEEAAARQAFAAGFAPEIVLFTQPDGHAVTRYVPDAKPVSIKELVKPAMVRRVANRLRDVHALPPIEGIFDPYAVIQRWMETLATRDTPLPDRLGGLLELVEAAERRRPMPQQSSMVLCHNDPYHLNFLDDDTLWLIDWEYAGMGDPMYDLAGVGHALDDVGRDLLLATYYGSIEPEMRHDLELLIPVFVCWNVMWSLIQVEGGVPDFDYRQMAEQYLDEVPGL